MKNFESLNSWAISALHQFGFHKVLKIVNAETIVNKPLLNQELGHKSEWGGFYHLFQQENGIGLYMFNQIENKVQVVMVESEIDLKSLLQTKEIRTAEEILKESRQEALSDPRLIDEKKKIEEFITKNQRDKKNEKVEVVLNNGAASNIESGEVGKIEATKRNSDKDGVFVFDSIKDLDKATILKRSTLSESAIAKFYPLKNLDDAYTVNLESKTIIFGKEMLLKKGQVLLPLSNKIHELLAVLTLNDNGQVLDSFVVSPRPQTVNCYRFGNVDIENSKWIFIVNDLISALVLKSEIDVNVLVCEDERSINDLIVDLRNRSKTLKIGQFLNGRLTMNQIISIYKQDMLGVYYFNIAPDFQGESNWSSYIVAQSGSSSFSLQALIKNNVKSQAQRVNKLQSNSE